jgi:hypothetical protein
MSAGTASRRWRTAVRLARAAVAWSAGLLLAALVLPVYSTSTASATDGVTLTHSTLVQVNGARALVLMAVPVLMAVLVLLAIGARRRGARWGGPIAWAAVGVLAAECVLGILTIGAFILPAAVLLAAAVRLAPGAVDRDAAGTGRPADPAAAGTGRPADPAAAGTGRPADPAAAGTGRPADPAGPEPAPGT